MKPHEQAMKRSSLVTRAVWSTLACVFGGCLFLTGRLTAPQSAPPKPTVLRNPIGDSQRVIDDCRYVTQPLGTAQAASTANRVHEASVVRQAPDPVVLASTLLAQTVDSLSVPPSIPGSRQNNLETSARSVRQFVRGLSAGLRAADPMVIHALASEITNNLCGTSLTQEKSLVLAYMLQDIPEASTSEGFDCFFEQNKEKGALPVREMLAAWRRSELEVSPAIAGVEDNAADERRRQQIADTENFQVLPMNPSGSLVQPTMSSAERKSFVETRSTRKP